MNQFVVDIYADDFERHLQCACIYCGNTTSMTRDHVVAVSWTGFKRSYSKGDTVPACKECNNLLSDKPLFSISSRANFIAQRLQSKYRKILNSPFWDDEELKLMSYEFRVTLKGIRNIKNFIQARIHHAILMSLEEGVLTSIKQRTHDDNQTYRILDYLYHGNSYASAECEFGIEISDIKKLINSKQSSSIINYFKWDNKIPFDESILKAIQARQRTFQKKMNSDGGATQHSVETF
jgi:hypothetical protein